MTAPKNQLFYGDNYEVLQLHIPDESVDLIYLDPPFNSRQDYNVLFAEKDGTQSSSQIRAFEDTWEWNIDAERSYEHVVEQGGQVAEALRAFRTYLHGSDMMAYLAMMAPRLKQLRRVLKETGSIYLQRSNRKPLSEDPNGCCLRTAELPERDYLETEGWARRNK